MMIDYMNNKNKYKRENYKTLKRKNEKDEIGNILLKHVLTVYS
jgi:hypothetical protein